MTRVKDTMLRLSLFKWLLLTSFLLSISASIYSYHMDYMLAYGDAESHLNIAKRITTSLTPGFAQLGGVWLPLTHVLMTPFAYFDFLWRSGFAGALVSGLAFVITCLYMYKLIFLITSNIAASVMGFLILALNPNILYMQSTAMTEVPFLCFYVLSIFYFITFLKKDYEVLPLIYAGFFCFLATLTRYDGWALAFIEAFILTICLVYKFAERNFSTKSKWHVLEGSLILFSSLAFLGIAAWFAWDYLILNDPFYFTNSPFSAKSQQQGWFARGELLTYHNLYLSFVYYTFASIKNAGIITSAFFLLGIIFFLSDFKQKERFSLIVLLFSPFLFNVFTLYSGQSVIFIPELTPSLFRWNLFNVRYGLLMVPSAAFFAGFLFHKFPFLSSQPKKSSQFITSPEFGYFNKSLLLVPILIQFFLFFTEGEPTITLEDGIRGLSSQTKTSVQSWILNHYDGGLVLMDDFSRTLSIIKTNIPMQNMIYIGNKPYWNESFNEPEKYVTWIVMQKNDPVWKGIYEKEEMRSRLYKYFQKVYTSPEILVFKKIDFHTSYKSQ